MHILTVIYINTHNTHNTHKCVCIFWFSKLSDGSMINNKISDELKVILIINKHVSVKGVPIITACLQDI